MNKDIPTLLSQNRRAVHRAQVDYLYQQFPRLLAFSLLVTLLLVAMLHDAVAVSHATGWLAAMMIVLVLRTILYFRYKKTGDSSSIDKWAILYVLFAGISGLIWGSAGVVLFAPDQLELQALILLVLAGMGAASASVLPMYLPAFYAYLPASMIPVGIMMFYQGGSFHIFMGFFDLVFLVSVLLFGRAIGEAFRTSLELRFVNLDLVEDLQKQKDSLQRANLAKSKFLAAASHDLRQPMHALSLFSEILNQQAPDRQTRELAGHISSSVGVLERMFASLLDISRLDAGVLTPEIEVFHLQDVIDHVFNDCQPDAQAKNLELRIETCDAWTRSDPTLLERILRNLVVNAIRYTHTGSVTIRGEIVSEGIRLSVEDTGIGIEADQMENVFEEFTQLGNPERDRTKGLGLGLSIVRRLARLLNYPIEMRSQPGRGTCVSLMLKSCEQPEVDRNTPSLISSLGEINLSLKVLVIDDDPEVRTGMKLLLESWGCSVVCSAKADEAMQVVTAQQFDAVVADFRLPENVHGTLLIEKIRKLSGRQIPALLVTGDTETARLQEARDYGLDLLHKPVQPSRLRTWLQRSQLT